MKKRLLLSAVAVLALFAVKSTIAQSSSAPHVGPDGIQRCATMEHLELQKQQDPTLEARMQIMEEESQAWISKNAKNPQPQAVITIPVVFHVVWNTTAENLSDAMIQGQLAVLNKDYSKTNSDWTQTPAAFTSLVANCQIQFCLASKDPSGAATNGIVRKQTTITEFGQDARMKYTAQGGSDAWDPTKYLNIWVIDFGSSGLLGYATFPASGPPLEQGVVIEYKSLPGAPVMSGYDLGRSATHEVGHYLGLYHIWGNSGSCGNDNISDTPPAQQPNYNCPSHPWRLGTCAGNTTGEMFMNYMDYVPDNCMVMFSVGQSTKMTSVLNTTRSGLGAAAATKCGAGTGIDESISADNISLYPNPSTGDLFMTVNIPGVSSSDIVIYNAIGEAVLEKRVTVSDEIKVDMNSHPNGMYLVKLKTIEGTVTKKIIINR